MLRLFFLLSPPLLSQLFSQKNQKGGQVIASSSVVDILKIGKKAGYKIIANTFNNKNPKE